jgi:hypothetical protein
MNARYSFARFACLAAVVLCGVGFGGCKNQISATVTEQMTWECIAPPASAAKGDGSVQTARFRYVKNPHYEEVFAAPGLCDSLSKTGGKVVPAEFEVFGTSAKGIVWYHEKMIAGHEYKMLQSTSGSYGEPGTFPLERDFRDTLMRQ